MPYYVDNERQFAIWFIKPNGLEEWIIGHLSNIEEGKEYREIIFFQNDEFVECPTDTNDWREYRGDIWGDIPDGNSIWQLLMEISLWNTNLNVKLSCHNDTDRITQLNNTN